MTIDMDDSKITDIAGIQKFLKGITGLKLKGLSRDEKYTWLNQTLQRFGYFKLRKKEKAILKRYLQTITGYSDAQITRLITRKRRQGSIRVTGQVAPPQPWRSLKIFPQPIFIDEADNYLFLIHVGLGAT